MDRNPYAAPVANVDPVKEPRERPWPVKAALSLFGVALVSSVPPVVYRFASVGSGSHSPTLDHVAATIGLLVMLGLASLVFTGIWRGWRWGRILYAVVVVLGSISAYTAVPVWFSRSTYLGVADLLSTLADIAALALLFTPAANAFFRKG